jgi:CheY-like chemotaxis protein
VNILIAEDDPTIQLLYQELMEDWGFEFDLAVDGEEAVGLARASGASYDLCIMDIDMPVMNGIEATRSIRKHNPYFPILACTSDPGCMQVCLQAGMDDFLTKPLIADSLRNKIDELTVKQGFLYIDRNSISLQWKPPADYRELEELRDLDRQGFSRLILVDASQKLLVHKGVGTELECDFISGKQLSTEFLDHNPNEPGVVRIYAPRIYARKTLLSQSRYEQLAPKENDERVGVGEGSDQGNLLKKI